MATLSQVGIPSAGTGILHPKHKNRFQVRFVNIAAGSSNGTNLTRQVVTANRPTLEFEEIKLDRYNSVAFVAGKHSWTEFQVTLEDDLTGLASTVIQRQLELQQRLIGADHTAGQWLNAAPTASAYKFSSQLQMLDGNEVVSEEWNMEGCWIKTAEYGDLDYADSGQVTISLTIRYDHAWQAINNAAAGSFGINATNGFLSSGSGFNAGSLA